MIICNSRRFVFVHIHRTGGSSVERAIEPILSWNDLILGSTPFGERIQGPYYSRFGLHKHSTLGDIERVCGSFLVKDYYVFATVRHPIARLCSLYNFLASTLHSIGVKHGKSLEELAAIAAAGNSSIAEMHWQEIKIFLETKTFSEFIHDERLLQFLSFATQVSSLHNSNGKISAAFLRIEEAAGWLPAVRNRLGFDLQIGMENASERKLMTPDLVSSQDLHFLQERFAEDYAAFGYEIEHA